MIKDIGAERAVLAGILQYGLNVFMEVSDILNISCFTTEINQILYKCIENILSKGTDKVDVALLYSAATSLGFEKLITEATESQKFIRSLYAFPIEFTSVRPLSLKIAKLSIVRKSQQGHKEAFDKLNHITGDESIDDILSISEAPFADTLSNLNSSENVTSITEGVVDYVNDLIDNPPGQVGIPTPFPIFNYVIGGGLRTGVHLISARFKIGKSSLGKCTAIHTSFKLKIPTLYIDTEMSKEEQLNRVLAELALVNSEEIETGAFAKDPAKKNRVLEAAAKIDQMKDVFFYKNVAGKDFPSILNYMKRWLHQSVGFENGMPKPHIIVYDYFKMMDTSELDDMKEYQAMGFQISALHDFCQKYQTPILSFVQTNRDGLTKESTDVIAQSDRLGWNCISLSLYKRKSPEEIADDGIENGTMKLVPLEGRFMKRLDDGDYINMQFTGEYSMIKELKTRNMLKKSNGNN